MPTILKRILGLVGIFVFAVGGITVLYVDPLSILTCHHLEPKHIDCQLQERIVWWIPVQETRIAQVTRAYVNRERVTRRDDNGNDDTYFAHHVILVSASGEKEVRNTNRNRSLAEQITDQINDYLNVSTSEPLTIWGHDLFKHTVFTLIGGAMFILFGFTFIATIINSVLLFGAWLVEFILLVVGWVVGRFGFWPEVYDQIKRFRRMMRSIAIQPDH